MEGLEARLGGLALDPSVPVDTSALEEVLQLMRH